MKKFYFFFAAALFVTQAFSQQMSEAETKAPQLANDGKLTEAIAAFETILKSDPKNANTINILAKIYEKPCDTHKHMCLKVGP